HNNDQKLLLEILVPAERHQVEATAGDQKRYEAEYLPKLITAAMEEIYSAGIRPEVWKVEGVPTVEGSKAIGEVAMATGADCLVLGRAADAVTVGQWLSARDRSHGAQGSGPGRAPGRGHAQGTRRASRPPRRAGGALPQRGAGDIRQRRRPPRRARRDHRGGGCRRLRRVRRGSAEVGRRGHGPREGGDGPPHRRRLRRLQRRREPPFRLQPGDLGGLLALT